jgi:hypothetical protein
MDNTEVLAVVVSDPEPANDGLLTEEMVAVVTSTVISGVPGGIMVSLTK